MHNVPPVVVDLRCLQDENYRERGVGRHALGLLRHARENSAFAAAHPLVGITDRALPALRPDAAALVDRVQDTGYVPDMRGGWFVQLSPMTHDPLVTARLLEAAGCLSAAAVYDFIPLDLPDIYLPDRRNRLDYHVRLAWLSRYHLFMPISRLSATRLREVLNVAEADVTVTGAPLDPGFERAARSAHEEVLAGRHLLVIGGGDPRKNVECAVRAHARCTAMREAGVPIVVTGRYGTGELAALQRLHREHGGRPGQLRVPGHVEEAELLRLYREAFCVVTASRAEGFSLPVIEAMAVAAPSIASRIPAHQELVEDDALLFDPEDDAALAAILERTLEPGWRRAVVEAQSAVWPRFRTTEVARLFWSAVQAREEARTAAAPPAPAIGRARRPRVALLSPLPPDRSGVADYTAACCAELGRRVDLHVFTEAAAPLPVAHASVAPLSALPLVSGRFDRVVGVMGNSHFHLRIFELLMRYGGACICHDARLPGFYRALLGERRATEVAEAELGRPLLPGELDEWERDESRLKACFLGEVARVAEPLFLHSHPAARMVAERFGVVPVVLPFSIRRSWEGGELAEPMRRAARGRLGIAPGEILLATFGFVVPSKGPEECVWALDVLRGWGIPARLAFVGGTSMDVAPLLRLCARLGLEEHVLFTDGFAEDALYRDYVMAADYAIQLRTYGMGLSGALLDCIAAGLPSVANADMADGMEAPDYVARVPDNLAPLLVAERIADMVGENRHARRDTPERRAFTTLHSFASYADQLCESLGIQV